MEIERMSLISGARKARGTAIIIDVFRAFTTAAHVMANGADLIIPAGSLNEAYEMKRKCPDWVLMGEREGRILDGFDYGNSPFEIKQVDFAGKTVILTTSAGTQGIVNATDIEELLLGSFVTAGAIIEFVRKDNPEIVSLVAMGSQGIERSIEDELCAIYIEDSLGGRMPDFDDMKCRIRQDPSVAKFFDPNLPQYHEEDFYMALELDRFSFVLKVFKEGNIPVVNKIT